MADPIAQLQTKSSSPVAERLVSLRRSANGVTAYPGEMPTSLEAAYAIQDAAIDMWPDSIVGWKVGGINPPFSGELGTRKLAGPVFSQRFQTNPNSQMKLPAFKSGFAAIEGEVAAVIARDTPADKTEYTTQEARDFIRSLHIGLEVASSPFQGINDHGPLVTISDFGNNHGLVLGDEIPNWRDFVEGAHTFAVTINGEEIGRASPEAFPGGPVESVRFILENTARRGRPLKAGMVILTGAVTGVHAAHVGDEALIECEGCAPISCVLVPAEPV